MGKNNNANLVESDWLKKKKNLVECACVGEQLKTVISNIGKW